MKGCGQLSRPRRANRSLISITADRSQNPVRSASPFSLSLFARCLLYPTPPQAKLYPYIHFSPSLPFLLSQLCFGVDVAHEFCRRHIAVSRWAPLHFYPCRLSATRLLLPQTGQNCTQPPLLPPITHPRTISPHVAVCARIDRTLLSAGCNTVETLSHLICIEFSFSFYMADHVLTYPQRVSFRNIIATL